MTRRYELKKRAERQLVTRRRIVEAAIELHATKGPARTTLSDVARLAGVQRHTIYRHFPQERDLYLACSGLHMETNPPPDASGWGEPEPAARLRRGLGELYDWFERVEDMLGSVLRDAEVHPLTREMMELRAGPALDRIRAALGEVVPEAHRTQASLDLALDFHAWQRLRASGLDNVEAADAMTRAILCQ